MPRHQRDERAGHTACAWQARQDAVGRAAGAAAAVTNAANDALRPFGKTITEFR
jgi:hypothetical protein